MVDAGFVPLDVVLRNHEPSRQQLATKLLFLVSQQLSAMHSAGKVHGDLRCEHILVAPDLQTVTLGGLAHSFDWNELRFRVRSSDTTASELGISVSSAVRWRAPECVGGAVPSPASDMYAFGMTVYEALTGTVPFEDHDEISVVDLKKRKQTVLPDRHLAKLDREAWSLVQDACHHNPIFRPSVQIAMMTLRNLQSKAPTSATVTYPASTHPVVPHRVIAPTTGSSSEYATPATQVTSAGFAVTQAYAPSGGATSAMPVLYGATPAPTSASSSGYAATATYQYPVSTSVPSHVPGALDLTTSTMSTVRPTGDVKVLPVGSGSVPAYAASSGQNSVPTVNPTPVWKKVAGLAVLAAIAVSVAVPLSLSTGSTASTSSDDSTSPTPTPTPSPSETPTPLPTPSWAWTPTPNPEPTPSPTTTPPVTTPTPTTKTPVYLPTRLPSSGSLVTTPLEGVRSFSGIARASDGTVYVLDMFVIYSFREDTAVATHVAGSGSGYANGPAADALFGAIAGIAIDAQGNLLVADDFNLRVRKVRLDTNPFTVEDVAGSGQRETHIGTLMQATFKSLSDIAVSPTNGVVYVTSNFGEAVRKEDIANDQVSNWMLWVDSVIAVAVDPKTDQVYVSSGSMIKRITADGQYIHRIAGTGAHGYLDGNSWDAVFSSINGLAFSPTGDFLYISDTGNNCIRKLDVTNWEVTTVAGLCDLSSSGASVDGDYSSARFLAPVSLAVGSDGTLLVAERSGRVRRIQLP